MIILISDLHLKSYQQCAFLLLKKWLATRINAISALYILGDFFDCWLGSAQAHDPQIAPIIQWLRRLCARPHIKVYFMRGNRDILLTRSFVLSLKAHFLPDEHLLNAFGNQYLLMHGDTLCTRDATHQLARKWLVTFYHTLRGRYILPYSLLCHLGPKIQSYAKQETQKKQQDIMDVEQTAVKHVLQKHHANTLVHGHTHKPQLHTESDNTRRFVLGSWDEGAPIYGAIDTNGLRLESLPSV